MSASDHLSAEQFDVFTTTHNDLKDKKPPRRHRVAVSTEYGEDAPLVAAQLAAAVHHRIPVSAHARI